MYIICNWVLPLYYIFTLWGWWYMGQLFFQCCLGTFPLRMGNKFLSRYFRSVVGPVSHLVARWWQHCLKSCPMFHQPQVPQVSPLTPQLVSVPLLDCSKDTETQWLESEIHSAVECNSKAFNEEYIWILNRFYSWSGLTLIMPSFLVSSFSQRPLTVFPTHTHTHAHLSGALKR